MARFDNLAGMSLDELLLHRAPTESLTAFAVRAGITPRTLLAARKGEWKVAHKVTVGKIAKALRLPPAIVAGAIELSRAAAVEG
jgi:hypothetical protein